jgi:hypothetical protein
MAAADLHRRAIKHSELIRFLLRLRKTLLRSTTKTLVALFLDAIRSIFFAVAITLLKSQNKTEECPILGIALIKSSSA